MVRSPFCYCETATTEAVSNSHHLILASGETEKRRRLCLHCVTANPGSGFVVGVGNRIIVRNGDFDRVSANQEADIFHYHPRCLCDMMIRDCESRRGRFVSDIERDVIY